MLPDWSGLIQLVNDASKGEEGRVFQMGGMAMAKKPLFLFAAQEGSDQHVFWMPDVFLRHEGAVMKGTRGLSSGGLFHQE